MFKLEKSIFGSIKRKSGKWFLFMLALVWAVFIPVVPAQGIGLEDVTVTASIGDKTGVQTVTVHSADQGETLRDLARLLNFDVELVAAMNNLEPDVGLQAGQVIIFPAEAAITYIVQAGDTLWDLAEVYGTQVERIVSENDLVDANRLLVGQEISIPAPRVERVFAAAREMRSRGAEGTFKVLSAGAGEMGREAVAAELSEDSEPVENSAGTGDTWSRLAHLQWPAEGAISSVFGMRDDQMHEGLDIAAPEGVVIRAALPGSVVFAGERGTYGNAVILRHDAGIRTLYAHASRILVNQGEWVEQGAPIAEVGNTGRSTGSHLHFELLLNGVPLDPEQYLP